LLVGLTHHGGYRNLFTGLRESRVTNPPLHCSRSMDPSDLKLCLMSFATLGIFVFSVAVALAG
jgi:hypothetical protein